MQERDDKGEKVFRGPRVRMGIHWAVEGTVANRSLSSDCPALLRCNCPALPCSAAILLALNPVPVAEPIPEHTSLHCLYSQKVPVLHLPCSAIAQPSCAAPALPCLALQQFCWPSYLVADPIVDKPSLVLCTGF